MHKTQKATDSWGGEKKKKAHRGGGKKAGKGRGGADFSGICLCKKHKENSEKM